MNVLWLTRKGEDFCCAPRTRHEFEQEVASITHSKFIGQGWEEHIPGESIRDSVNRVMPDVDWVIDRDYNLKEVKPQDLRVGHFISDLHGKQKYRAFRAHQHIKLLNEAGYTAIFMRYTELHGTKEDVDVYKTTLLPSAYWVPWSVNPKRHYPRGKIDYDVACMGTLSPKVYPLRTKMMKEMVTLQDEYRTLSRMAPKGTSFERLADDEYDGILGSIGIHIFDCSKYRYPLQKFFEGMASGCLVMSTRPGGSEKLGFVDEKTYVKVNRYNWKKKLLYYLENPGETKKIADRGRAMVLKYHTHEVRAKQFVRYLEDGIERGL